MDYLEELLQEAFDTNPISEPPRGQAPRHSACSACRNTQTGLHLIGQYDGEKQEVHLDFVPDKSDPHCDILVTGASLRREANELLVESIADDAEALVEVKSSADRSRRFELSGPEHSDAQDHPESYFIIRVVNTESESRHVDTVFDSVPELDTQVTNNRRLEIRRYDYTLELSY